VSIQRALFVNHQLLVTRYQVGELYACGNYPNQLQEGRLTKLFFPVEPFSEKTGDDVEVWYPTGFSPFTPT
jgi:Cu2+-containing amine oxidase